MVPDARALAGRVAVVTGASRGIGFAVAQTLAAAGAHVFALSRTVGGLEELDDAIRAAGGSATLVPLDLNDGPGLDRLGGAIHERHGRLDILVANAGTLGQLSPLSHVDPEVWDATVALNLTANWRLIRSLDPLLRASDAGRAVFVSSGVARRPRAYWGPYSVSKAALEALALTWAQEVAMTPLKVNIFNPGPTRTRMRAQAMPGEDPTTLPSPDDIAPHVVALCLPALTTTGGLYDVASRGFV